MDYQSYEATIISVIDESPSVKSFDMSLTGGNFDFFPGQYIDLFVETPVGTIVGGYSITSAPIHNKNRISIAVKKIEGALATVQLHERTNVGDTFHLQGPGGDFYYEKDIKKPVVFIAGGIGITPFISMMRYIDNTNPTLPVALIYSAKIPSELIFKEEIINIAERNASMNPTFTITQPSETKGDWEGRIGRIDKSLLSKVTSQKSNLFLISGPGEMQENVEANLIDLGVLRDNIKREAW